MAEHVNKTPDRKSQAAGYKTAQLQGGSGPGSGFVDKRAVGVMQRKLQEVADGSSRLSQLKDFQKMTVNRALTSQLNVFQQEGKWNSGNGTIQRMVNSDPSRMEEGLPSFYSDMDPTPSSLTVVSS